jgi:hypothetical protein
MMRSSFAALAFSCAATSVAAQDIELRSPIQCSLGDDCYIQQYVDHTKGKGASDFRCSNLSYNRHRGTDFAVRTLQQMHAGVNVVATADGTVKAVRRGIEDVIYSANNAADVNGRECGNGVVITHENGWETQYCHLKKGSLKVRKGNVVKAGSILGQIGLSGRTQFPHVHLTVRKDGEVVDPFDPDGKITCNAPETRGLWEKPLPYRAGGVLYVGFSDRVPEFKDIKNGRAAKPTLPDDAPALVIFGFGFGAQKGDQMRLILRGPDGVMVDQTVDIEKDQAQLFRAAGKRLTDETWQTGRYSGLVSLIRKGRVVNTEQAAIVIR